MQKDLGAIYRWAEKTKRNLMKINLKKWLTDHWKRWVEPYTSSGKEKEIKETVKDLGVLATN